MLTVDAFSKRYASHLAVDDLSFHVAPGEVVALVGPNGAGKTTTMRAVAGILAPTSGRILVDGHDVVADPVAAKRRLAYVPDDPRLFDVLTVDEHLAFAADAYAVGNADALAEDLLRRFDLLPHRDKAAGELSRGMRQKVAICCAYLHSPGLVMLDEPLTGLDPRGIRTMKETIHERARAGAAVIVSSHLLQLVEDLCTRLLILHEGRRRFFGTVDEARRAFTTGDGSLEEVFFRVTEGGA